MSSERPLRVAVVDDEANLRETVCLALGREGFETEAHADGLLAWEAFQEEPADLLILDILMPRMDGLELCRRIRSVSRRVPLLFLTSRDDEIDRVLGLEIGADDYLCKPFSMRELVARVRVLFRRLEVEKDDRPTRPERLLTVRDLQLDLDRFTVRLGDSLVPLTVTEFRLLEALIRHPGHVKTRAQLIRQGYPDDTWVSERTIDTHVKRLRRKLQSVRPAFEDIETVHGVGYRYREASG